MEDKLVMGEELRVMRPSINGLATKLREQYPELNRKERKRLARLLVQKN